MKALRSALALSLLIVLSCTTGPQAFALKQRAVGRTARTPAVTQWQHDWARGAVFYEVFVRSFQDSNGDGIGDIQGLIDRLDYLNDGKPETTTDLGIEGIWLMPVFQSPSYHGYDTTDYETIEQDYGTNADFQRLLEEAHKRGIGVIVDFVVNHSSSQHPWFVDAASSPSSPKRDWYVWSASNLGWGQPWGGGSTWHHANGSWYYGVFWSGMPDINWNNAEAKAEMLRLARHWLAQGVDGYRLDATRYLVETGGGAGQQDTPATHQALKDLAAAVRTTRPDAFLVAENWTTAPIIATYFGSTSVIQGGDEMPMNFNFPLAQAILDGVNTGSASPIASAISQMQALYPAGVIDAPFLTNHDQRRLATVLGNNASRMRNAAAILLTLPGTPFLYYGEEVGIQNGPTSGDESKRTPMPWTASGGFTTATSPWFGYAPGVATTNVASQTNDPGSLLSTYRNLIRVRTGSPGLRAGTLQMVGPNTQLLAFTRTAPEETVLVAHNVTDSYASLTVSLTASRLERLYGDVTPGGGSGAWTISLAPRTSGVWRVVP